VASTDPLTGLLNRRAFDEAIERELATAAAAGLTTGLLYIDLDKFKAINDTLGHAAGDELLVEVANRLRACIRGGDIAARLGGDEFALLLSNLPLEDGEEVAQRVADRAVASLCEPVQLAGAPRRIGGSIGVTVGEAGEVDPTTIVARADAAMYEAKRTGSGTLLARGAGLASAA
jgi:diguanylate cyclase (GGDEF)-like protein